MSPAHDFHPCRFGLNHSQLVHMCLCSPQQCSLICGELPFWRLSYLCAEEKKVCGSCILTELYQTSWTFQSNICKPLERVNSLSVSLDTSLYFPQPHLHTSRVWDCIVEKTTWFCGLGDLRASAFCSLCGWLSVIQCLPPLLMTWALYLQIVVREEMASPHFLISWFIVSLPSHCVRWRWGRASEFLEFSEMQSSMFSVLGASRWTVMIVHE